MKKVAKEEKRDLLRKNMRKKRAELSFEEQSHLSSLAAQHLLASEVWQQAKTVFLYMAVRGEISTNLLFSTAKEQKKRIGFPLCLEPGNMVFADCNEPEHFVSGYFGLLEPTPNREHILAPEATLVVTPGVAFTERGQRLGQGGGYYDRYFASPLAKNIVRVGFCYSFQIVPELDIEPWDVPMHMLCTEKRCYSFREK